jgi:hypothetical protein
VKIRNKNIMYPLIIIVFMEFFLNQYFYIYFFYLDFKDHSFIFQHSSINFNGLGVAKNQAGYYQFQNYYLSCKLNQSLYFH